MKEKKEKYINPFTDFGFKRLFGTEAHKELLIHFLNSVLPKRHQVKNLSYKKNEHLRMSEEDRRAVFDIYCESETGEKFIVEMQKAKQKFFKDRSIFYSSFPIVEQAKQGEWDFELSAVYTISFLDFTFNETKRSKKYFHVIKLKEDSTNEIFYDKLTYMYIELPKFTKTLDELETLFEKWVYAFKYLPSFENRPKKLEERVFASFFKAASIAQFNPDERAQYETSLKIYRDLFNVTTTAKEEGEQIGLQKGEQIGLQKGEQIGLQKGEQIGIEKGKIIAHRTMAKKLLEKGLSLSLISEATGISTAGLKKILK